MIGGSLIDCEEICGARILDKVCLFLLYDVQSKPKRKIIEYRLEIWFKDWSNEKFKEALKSRVLDNCKDYDYKPDVGFVRHEKEKYTWIVCYTNLIFWDPTLEQKVSILTSTMSDFSDDDLNDEKPTMSMPNVRNEQHLFTLVLSLWCS